MFEPIRMLLPDTALSQCGSERRYGVRGKSSIPDSSAVSRASRWVLMSSTGPAMWPSPMRTATCRRTRSRPRRVRSGSVRALGTRASARPDQAGTSADRLTQNATAGCGLLPLGTMQTVANVPAFRALHVFRRRSRGRAGARWLRNRFCCASVCLCQSDQPKR